MTTFLSKLALGCEHQDVVCHGDSFKEISINQLINKRILNLKPLIEYYKVVTSKNENFFLENLFFDKLAGTDKLRKQIISGLSEEEIRMTWQEDLEAFKVIRSKYLLYPDFD